jgi:hypothetical protein
MPSLQQAVRGVPPPFVTLIEELIEAAVVAAREARRKRRLRRDVRPRRGVTLRPGPDTPLWNQLRRNLRPYLRRWGSKAQLARLLGLPRQRLQDTLKAGTASLYAERTLLLLGWLGFFERGGHLAPTVRPGPKNGRSRRLHPGIV